jgi:hypothetical protein
MILCGMQRRVVRRCTGTLSWASVMPVFITTRMFSIPGSGGHVLGTWSVVAVEGEGEVVFVVVSILRPGVGSITSCVVLEPRSA